MKKTQTMKTCRIRLLALILAGLASMPARAEVIPGRWEKVSALEMASSITVELKNGDRIHGQFRGLSASALELLNPAGRAVIPKTDIQTVNLPSKDGLGDGAWKGAAVGAAVGGGLTLIGIATVEESTKTDTAFQGLILGALLTGIGVGLGIAVDAATETEDTVLYKAPATP